jgi:hypothetical protein
MKILGCDLHAKQQTIAMVDTETGEFTEKTLSHEGNEVREFYAALEGPVVVGIEATGAMQWFLELLEELGMVCRVGHPAKIRAAETRKQKHDRRDARLILDLLPGRMAFPRSGCRRASSATCEPCCGTVISGFYKKGCQEKKLGLDRRARRFLSRDPAHCCKCAPRFAREVLLCPCLSSLWGSSADGDNANRVWKLGKRVLVSSVSTMVLSEARGLSLFLVKRGGIA